MRKYSKIFKYSSKNNEQTKTLKKKDRFFKNLRVGGDINGAFERGAEQDADDPLVSVFGDSVVHCTWTTGLCLWDLYDPIGLNL